jgi:kinesin family protein 5
MTDSVRVVVRFRRDKEGEEVDDWTFDQENKLIKLREKKYTFDEILDMDCDQITMYEKLAVKSIDDFVNGFNGTLFAYGNSGSGKTYSIVGPDEITEFLAKDFNSVPENIQEMYGVLPRLTLRLFHSINEFTAQGATVCLNSAYIEIYNETITCLLNGKENLKVQEIPKVGFSISGNEWRPCIKPEDIFNIVYTGTKNKTVGGTNQNARSSRSHTVLTLELKVKTVDGSENCSKMNIVDLAGSEKLKNTGASTPERIKEAQKINLSLTTLGMCIMALSEPGSFVPFRNSKLTLILKESLGGNSKTTLLCAARRDKKLVDDNLNSLNFAVRAKQIKTKCVKNVKLSDKEVEYLTNALKVEICSLRKQVRELGHTFHKITDPKLLKLLDGALKDDDTGGDDVETSKTEINNTKTEPNSTNSVSNVPSKNYRKRVSLINLSEEEIIMKYCEVRAQYDNLLESAGNKILDLNARKFSSAINPETLIKLNNEHNLEIEKHKKEYDEELDKLKKSVEAVQEEKKKVVEEMEEAQADAKGLQDMLDLNSEDIEAMQAQVDEKEKEINKILLERSELEKTLESKNNELASTDEFMANLSKERDDLSDKNTEQESQINKLTTTDRERDLELSRLREEFEYFKKLREEDTKKIEALQTENDDKDKKLGELESKLKNKDNDILSKESTITNLTSEVNNLKTAQAKNVGDKEVFEQKDKLFNETKKILEDRIAQMNDQNHQLNEANDANNNKSKQEISNITKVVDQSKQKIDELNFELKSKTNELSSFKELGEQQSLKKEEELAAKSKELNDNKVQILEKEKVFYTKLLVVEEQAFAKDRQVNELEKELTGTKKANERVLLEKNKEVQDLKTEKAKLEAEVDKRVNKEIPELKDECVLLNNKISNYKQEYSDLKIKNKALDEVRHFFNLI